MTASPTMATAAFAVENVVCDYVMSAPIQGLDVAYDYFRHSSASNKVPVLRIFGPTPAGQKCCLFVHNQFPYFLVASPIADPSEQFLQELLNGIDRMVSSIMPVPGANTAIQQHVYKIKKTRAIPMYGYYKEEQLFLQIFMFNPQLTKRTAELLRSGVVMNLRLQPYELHVPYTLQFFIDRNLYGMSYTYCSDVLFRLEEDVGKDTSGSSNRSAKSYCDDVMLDSLVDPEALSERWISKGVKKVTVCELELDCCATKLLNSSLEATSNASTISNPGLRFIVEDEYKRQLNQDETLDNFLRFQATPDEEEDRTCTETETETRFKGMLANKLSAYPSDPPGLLTQHSIVSSLDESEIYSQDSPINEELLRSFSQSFSQQAERQLSEDVDCEAPDSPTFAGVAEQAVDCDSADENEHLDEAVEQDHLEMSQLVSTWSTPFETDDNVHDTASAKVVVASTSDNHTITNLKDKTRASKRSAALKSQPSDVGAATAATTMAKRTRSRRLAAKETKTESSKVQSDTKPPSPIEFDGARCRKGLKIKLKRRTGSSLIRPLSAKMTTTRSASRDMPPPPSRREVDRWVQRTDEQTGVVSDAESDDVIDMLSSDEELDLFVKEDSPFATAASPSAAPQSDDGSNDIQDVTGVSDSVRDDLSPEEDQPGPSSSVVLETAPQAGASLELHLDDEEIADDRTEVPVESQPFLPHHSPISPAAADMPAESLPTDSFAAVSFQEPTSQPLPSGDASNMLSVMHTSEYSDVPCTDNCDISSPIHKSRSVNSYENSVPSSAGHDYLLQVPPSVLNQDVQYQQNQSEGPMFCTGFNQQPAPVVVPPPVNNWDPAVADTGGFDDLASFFADHLPLFSQPAELSQLPVVTEPTPTAAAVSWSTLEPNTTAHHYAPAQMQQQQNSMAEMLTELHPQSRHYGVPHEAPYHHQQQPHSFAPEPWVYGHVGDDTADYYHYGQAAPTANDNICVVEVPPAVEMGEEPFPMDLHRVEVVIRTNANTGRLPRGHFDSIARETEEAIQQIRDSQVLTNAPSVNRVHLHVPRPPPYGIPDYRPQLPVFYHHESSPFRQPASVRNQQFVLHGPGGIDLPSCRHDTPKPSPLSFDAAPATSSKAQPVTMNWDEVIDEILDADSAQKLTSQKTIWTDYETIEADCRRIASRFVQSEFGPDVAEKTAYLTNPSSGDSPNFMASAKNARRNHSAVGDDCVSYSSSEGQCHTADSSPGNFVIVD